MAKELTEQDKQKIKDAIIASCISKGIKPTMQTTAGVVPNPQYASCVDLGYQDALKEAEKGKLGLWFTKVNSFVQSQGGVSGLFQTTASIAAQYRANTPNMLSTEIPNGGNLITPDLSKEKNDNMGLWFIIILMLVILIIAACVYFYKKHKTVK